MDTGREFIGNVYMTNNGNVKIIDYNGRDDVTVEFEDGTIGVHKRLQNIKSGYVSNKEQKEKCRMQKELCIIGTEIMTLRGKGTIIAYNSSTDITVKWESGKVQEHMQMSNIRKMQNRYNMSKN